MASSNSGDSKQPGGSERGGSGNFANDPQRASEAGKKGGQQSQGSPGSQQDSEKSQTGKSQTGKGGQQPQGGSAK